MLYKVVIAILAVCFPWINLVQSLPLNESSVDIDKPVEDPNKLIDHYDQRQNGSNNYHINVDGVVFIVAPADALLLAGAGLLEDDNIESSLSDIFGSDLSSPGNVSSSPSKPKPDNEIGSQNQTSSSSSSLSPSFLSALPLRKSHLRNKSRSSARLANLIAPFIRRFQAVDQHRRISNNLLPRRGSS